MKKIAYQGHEGAYSHLASLELFPEAELIPCVGFAQTFEALQSGKVDKAVIPVENSTAGRVADVHLLMKEKNVHIVGEYFLPIEHCLLGLRGAKIEDVKKVYSHVQALAQCDKNIRARGVSPKQFGDTAGAAKMVSESGNFEIAALASKIAAELYDLDILEESFHDTEHNTTRFLILSATEEVVKNRVNAITTLIFRTRHMPAALYKALGGFATNGLNLLKVESYVEGGSFEAAAFYVDVEGHMEDEPILRALEELNFFSQEVRVLGCYTAHSYRNMY